MSDSSPIYSVFASDPDLREMIRLFVAEISDRMAIFETHLASGNWTELARMAHQLKGAAGSHGFAELSVAATALDVAIRSQVGQASISVATTNVLALCRRITAQEP